LARYHEVVPDAELEPDVVGFDEPTGLKIPV
jgi:hypothetical protein